MQHQEFREKLNAAHQWPSLYMFKFVVPADKVEEVKALFPTHSATVKPSSKGKYVSVTTQMMASSAEEIMDKYMMASKIEGIIAL